MWQEIIVYIILTAALAAIVRLMWIRITCNPENEKNKCDACIGCPLKEKKKSE